MWYEEVLADTNRYYKFVQLPIPHRLALQKRASFGLVVYIPNVYVANSWCIRLISDGCVSNSQTHFLNNANKRGGIDAASPLPWYQWTVPCH